MGRKQRYRAVDLVHDLAVAHMEYNAGSGQKRAPRLFIHQVTAHGEDVRATAIGGIDAALCFGNMIQRMLHVLRVGCGPFVDDNEIEDHAARTQIFMGTQRLTGDVHVHIVVDAQAENREIAGNRKRPQGALRSESCFQRFRIRPQMHVGIGQISAEMLEGGRLL